MSNGENNCQCSQLKDKTKTSPWLSLLPFRDCHSWALIQYIIRCRWCCRLIFWFFQSRPLVKCRDIIVNYVTTDSFLSFPIHCSLTTPPFNAIIAELLTALFINRSLRSCFHVEIKTVLNHSLQSFIAPRVERVANTRQPRRLGQTVTAPDSDNCSPFMNTLPFPLPRMPLPRQPHPLYQYSPRNHSSFVLTVTFYYNFYMRLYCVVNSNFISALVIIIFISRPVFGCT